jgi:hypothetical protein
VPWLVGKFALLFIVYSWPLPFIVVHYASLFFLFPWNKVGQVFKKQRKKVLKLLLVKRMPLVRCNKNSDNTIFAMVFMYTFLACFVDDFCFASRSITSKRD